LEGKGVSRIVARKVRKVAKHYEAVRETRLEIGSVFAIVRGYKFATVGVELFQVVRRVVFAFGGFIITV